MKFENVLIIALIALIFVVIGAYIFVNGIGVSDSQPQDQIITSNPNTDSVNTVSQPSGQSSVSSSSSQADTASSADSSSESDASQDSSSQSSDSSAPQAGQAEGTYDPTDFD